MVKQPASGSSLLAGERDSSGYRRYTAHDVVELIKIRMLAEAGVPLARIRELKAAPDETFRGAIAQIDDELGGRIRSLRQTQRRLRELAEGGTRLLPAEVDHHLQLYLDYDRAHDLDPRDPFLTDLARRIVQATRQRYGPGDLPGQATDISQLVQGAVNALSPAWQQLDSLIRDHLRMSDRAGSRSSP